MASAPPPYDTAYPPEQGSAPPVYPPGTQPYPPVDQPMSYPPPGPPPSSYPPATYPQASQPAPYPPAAQDTAAATVIIQQPSTVYRDLPVTLPDGNVTILRYRNGLMTWVACLLICLFTLECCLCCFGLIPFCIPSVKDVEHIHPVTGQVVGVYHRL